MTEAEATNCKVYSLEEVSKHTSNKSCWIIVHGKVYDVTDFLEEHPGGYDIIIQVTGRDATQDFEEIGHSKPAYKLLEKHLIGTYEGGDSVPVPKALPKSVAPATRPTKDLASRTFQVLLPFLLLAIALGLHLIMSGK
eukprot:gene15450-21535_t